ncbi:hypothetical protein Mtc_1666 [Methanocella conradii HZ254]|uniref:Uncharacterized protein n=1 Tax=Methanocella conradii (strain DSM 24694 / JCM 17849 / CGMCC 1.5162 / HZ254) TaxID=1041930 RepID=H8I814_METCZ|nr:hypothetical protein [Methanocella conradii]AFD00414.1 hypothetical protein Mtc_1666 [Methanocella conradii HZ254]
MRRIYRILLIIILLIAALIMAIDYFGFHGTIMLDRIANGAIVKAIDSFWYLFEGPGGFTNLMFFAIIAVGLMVGLIAIIYKFIKG